MKFEQKYKNLNNIFEPNNTHNHSIETNFDLTPKPSVDASTVKQSDETTA